MDNFKTFISLTTPESVAEITDILNKNAIAFKVQDTSKDFDVTFSNDTTKNSYLIMLDPADFEKASTILDDKLNFDINEIDSMHPLFSFSEDELKDVVRNYDEWHPLDVKLAKYLLQKQNITVENSEIINQQRQKQLKSEEEEKTSSLTLIMGYAFCLMGGLAGIGIAIFLMTGKKTLADGSKKYIYSKSDRNHGKYMLILGAICLTFLLLI